MSLSSQFQKLKENWLLLAVILLLVIVLNNNSFLNNNLVNKISSPGIAYFEEDYARGSSAIDSYYPSFDQDFAPGVEDRKITKNVYQSMEVNRGDFDNKIKILKEIISENDVIVVNENINSYGENKNRQRSATYNLKILEINYKSFIGEINNLGDVESYSENARDITGNYLNTRDKITLEKQRLERYKSLLTSSNSIDEKISLTDRIYEQERTIKYLEESLNNKDLSLDYVTLNLNISEKSSNFAGTLFVSFKELIRTFVSSLNSLISIIIYLIPWLILIWIIRFFWRKNL